MEGRPNGEGKLLLEDVGLYEGSVDEVPKGRGRMLFNNKSYY